MPSILVVEQEGRYIERIHDALTSEGWQVKVVNDRDGALRAAAAEGPTLLLVSAEVAGARDLLAQFSRQRGGPGTVALVPESQAAAATATELGSDDLLAKPFTDQDLRLMVRRCLNAASRQVSEAHAAKTRRLTAREIFGDLVAEVEAEADPAAAPAAPLPAAHAAPAAPKTAAAGAMDKRIEATLSGLRDSAREARRKPAPHQAAPGRGGVDALLKETLSGLALDGAKAKPAGAPPTAPSTRRAEPGPAAGARPARSRTPAPPSSAPVVMPPMPTGESKPKTASGVTPAPRRSGEIDLARLDELVKPSPRPAASRGSGSGVRAADDAFRTQRLETLRPAPPAAPREFGQYTLLDRVAVGGMAEVWKARMKGVEGFQKTVAIKKILSHLTDSVDFVTMFIDEAKLAAQLTHDNIIHIYDLGKIGEDYYIAMEYVDGKDLRSILNAARAAGMPLPAPLALFIAARLASALDHAHRKRDFENRELGLVHRDVSPQNVLVGYEGEIKLCDFGIVKAVSKASKTQMGALKGKLQYMSPEQAWGKPVDARSDLFSLGAILFEMLTGRRLFAGDNEISVLESVREGRIDRPRDVNPAVAPEVDALVVRALAKDPDERFQSAGEMQRELERLLSALRPAPTQSDLAAFLRGLFGDPARAAAAAPARAPAATRAVVPAAHTLPPPAEAVVAGAEVEAVAPAFGASLEAEGEGRGKRLLVAAIAAAIALGVALWLVFGRSRPAATSGPQSAPAVSTEPAPLAPQPVAEELSPAQPTPAAAAAGGATGAAVPTTAARVPAAKAPPGAAAPAADLQTRVDQEVARREAEMRQKLEADRRRLEEQVAEARAAAEAPPPAPPAAAEPAAPPPQQEAAPPEPAASEPVPSEPAPPPASEPAPVEPSAPPPSEGASAEPAPPPAPAPVEPPAPSAPSVTVGELVSGGPGVRPPVLVTVPKPGYPPIAQRMRVEGVVTVEVLVDEDGNVRDSRMVKRVAQDVGLNEAALAAARKARFKPATKEGVRVRMWYTLTFPFQL